MWKETHKRDLPIRYTFVDHVCVYIDDVCVCVCVYACVHVCVCARARVCVCVWIVDVRVCVYRICNTEGFFWAERSALKNMTCSIVIPNRRAISKTCSPCFTCVCTEEWVERGGGYRGRGRGGKERQKERKRERKKERGKREREKTQKRQRRLCTYLVQLS